MKINEFLRLRANEVMVTDVTTLRPDETLANAAHKFLHQQISGAPVVNEAGECVGVLSVTDVVGAAEKAETRQAEIAEAFFAKSDLVLPVSVYEEDLAEVRDNLGPTAEQPVANFMVKDVVAVKANDAIETIIRDFVDAHIHRVLVVDDVGKLVGLISTIDVMAKLLRSTAS